MHYKNLIIACLYGVCAILWLINGLRDQNVFDFILAAVWLTGAIVWLVRYFKEKKKER